MLPTNCQPAQPTCGSAVAAWGRHLQQHRCYRHEQLDKCYASKPSRHTLGCECQCMELSLGCALW